MESSLNEDKINLLHSFLDKELESLKALGEESRQSPFRREHLYSNQSQQQHQQRLGNTREETNSSGSVQKHALSKKLKYDVSHKSRSRSLTPEGASASASASASGAVQSGRVLQMTNINGGNQQLDSKSARMQAELLDL